MNMMTTGAAAPASATTDWVIPGHVAAGRVEVITGPKETGKTNKALDWAYQVAIGGVVDWKRVEAAEALYLTLEEDRPAIEARRQAVLGDEPWPYNLMIGDYETSRQEGETIGALVRAWVAAMTTPRLVVLDEINWMPHDQLQACGSNKFWQGLAAELSIAVVIVRRTKA